ncbi:MAG: hypothetical protein E4H14_01895 [Candidatus Thorarchaeota archaeon]|nr:MAG: hypothetical protein E4H14_01895 [Candidatus Thorarchaeota archaeon]
MTQIKHVLVLLLLVLPMFALAPSLVAGPNEAFTNRAEIETSIPAQFVEENLRVAVYAETNTTLPSYASGGVSTANHANLFQFLGTNGFTVTLLSTQDILDHKLMAARFDVFILPNNLPKDEIVNQVKDYWLAGGGILSFDSGLGYLYYHGMIVAGETGDYALLNVDVTEHWGFDYVENITVGARHSTAKSYQANDIIVAQENITVHDRGHFSDANVEDFVPLLIEQGNPGTSVGFALDNSARQGGRIVQLPGNCSEIPVWERPIITDAINWLAPRPKAKVAIDFTHAPYYGVDSWDDNVSYASRYYTWRNFAVNHSNTFDKLYPVYGELLTADDISEFDVLIINMPTVNYTASEISVIRTWVQNGGGLYLMGESYGGYTAYDQRLNAIVDGLGISINTTMTYPGASVFTDFAPHPLFEEISSIRVPVGSTIDILPPAYPLMEDGTGDIVMGGLDVGDGRIVMVGDVNHFDYTYIELEDNSILSTNLLNWLSSGTAEVLVYADYGYDVRDPNRNPSQGPVALALNELGIPYYLTTQAYSFNLSLFSQDWNMVILDNIYSGTSSYQHHLMDYVNSGGKLIMNTWSMNAGIMDYFGIDSIDYLGTSPWTLYLWDETHPIFSLPVDYGADNVSSSLDVYGGGGTYAINFTIFDNATALAGFSPTDDGGAGIILSAEGRAIMNGPLLSLYGEDTDDSTYMDAYELWLNEIGFLYYDRPMVNHPDDVTYTETETGNEITWMPVADAGPWEYVVRENGSIIDSGHWSGGSITIDVDGVNASITDYQLTVFDRLGYSDSDIVVLNVTAYVAPTTTPTGSGEPIDPTLLLIIGGAIAGIVILLIVVMQLKKKK